MNKKIQPIIGKSPSIQAVLRTADLIAGTDVPVLIKGKTGTGKDLFANRIHQQSKRKQGALIKVNCASLSDDLTGEMLFAKKGLIEKAQNGTLYLDGVSRLIPPLQEKILAFIETLSLSFSTGSKTKNYNVRIIASTNTSLLADVEAGKFRADLYYRLNVIPLELPDLSERDGDIQLLMDSFMRDLVHTHHQRSPEFSHAAMQLILKHNWPGNVRELYNFCERMFALFSEKVIDVANLPSELRPQFKPKSSPFSLPESGIKLEALEVDFILQALNTTGGNKSQAARLLGLTRDTFLYRLKKYSIDI